MKKRLNLTLNEEIYSELVTKAHRCGFRSAATFVSKLLGVCLRPPVQAAELEVCDEIEDLFSELSQTEMNKYEINNRL